MVDQLKQFLEQHYPFKVESIAPAPRQFVAETYVVHTCDGERFFVKLFRKERLPRLAIGSLPVLIEMYRKGIEQINYPIAATSGALYTLCDDDMVVVFNYIRGEQTDDYDMYRLGDLLAQVHQQTGRITTTIVQEAFDPPYSAELQESLTRVWEHPAPDSILLRLQQFLKEYGDEITQDWNDFGEIGRRCRAAHFDLLLTHSDAPGNVLKEPDGTIYLVDWDEILLAPAERDTWFCMDDPRFMRGYRSRFPGYIPNDAAFRFYLYNRYFEDLLGYVQEILGDNTVEHRTVMLRDLDNTCVRWLRPKLRALDHKP